MVNNSTLVLSTASLVFTCRSLVWRLYWVHISSGQCFWLLPSYLPSCNVYCCRFALRALASCSSTSTRRSRPANVRTRLQFFLYVSLLNKLYIYGSSNKTFGIEKIIWLNILPHSKKWLIFNPEMCQKGMNPTQNVGLF